MIESIYKYSIKQICYALYGTLLGDSCYSSKTKWLKVKHTNKQRNYVKALDKLYSRWGLQVSTTYDYESTTKFGDVIYSEIRVKLTLPMQRHIGRMYNKFGKKFASAYSLRRVNKLGLLLWWLDDGCLKIGRHMYDKSRNRYKISRQSTIHTNGFSDVERSVISKYLLKRFDISTTLQKARSYYSGRLSYYHYLSPTSFRKFIDMIYPVLHFVPENMIYKLNMQYDVGNSDIDKKFAEKYNFDSKEELLQKQLYYCK